MLICYFAVHGGWTEWEESECVGTCHGANRTRHRTCTNPSPRYEGRNCSGPAEEVLKCIPDHCNCKDKPKRLDINHIAMILPPPLHSSFRYM